MDIFLDTNVLLWSLFDRDRIPTSVKELIENENNTILYSVASLWEIEIKHNKHPELMPYSFKQLYPIIFENTDYIPESVRTEHLLFLKEIIDKNIHSDPFDHIILASAIYEKAKLITGDKVMGFYKDNVTDVLVI